MGVVSLCRHLHVCVYVFFVYHYNIIFFPTDLCVFVCVNECVQFGYEQSTQMSHLLCTGLEATCAYTPRHQ